MSKTLFFLSFFSPNKRKRLSIHSRLLEDTTWTCLASVTVMSLQTTIWMVPFPYTCGSDLRVILETLQKHHILTLVMDTLWVCPGSIQHLYCPSSSCLCSLPSLPSGYRAVQCAQRTLGSWWWRLHRMGLVGSLCLQIWRFPPGKLKIWSSSKNRAWPAN